MNPTMMSIDRISEIVYHMVMNANETYCTMTFVVKLPIEDADDLADFIGQKNDLAILSVEPSTEEELAQFDPVYLKLATGESLG